MITAVTPLPKTQLAKIEQGTLRASNLALAFQLGQEAAQKDYPEKLRELNRHFPADLMARFIFDEGASGSASSD